MYTLSEEQTTNIHGGCVCLATSFCFFAMGASSATAAYTSNMTLLYGVSATLFVLAGVYGWSYMNAITSSPK